MNSPGTRRQNSGSRGRGSTAGSESQKPPVDVDYSVNPDAYFGKLEQFKKHSETVRKHEMEQEKTLMEYLPVNEKFNLNKEGKVIARWQERQRDWERIEAKIKRRLTSKVQRPLMMTTTDEYRARIEEYDLLQAAVPLKDRFSDTSWQVMLRGGGPIRVAVGHIFSGIECVFELEIPKPKIVRKPKPMQGVGKNDTFVDQSVTYMAVKKRYESTRKEIRPHDLTYHDAGLLVMRSQPLFQWAKDSSSAYFAAQRNEFPTEVALTLAEAEQAGAHKAATQVEVNEMLDTQSASYVGETSGSRVDFLSTKEVVFSAQCGKKATQKVVFRNSGTTAVHYRWKCGRGAKHTHEGKETLHNILDSKGSDGGTLRGRMLAQQRDCFFCLEETGQLLPDETASSIFVFNSCVGGSFASDWILQLVPEETGIFIQTDAPPSPNNASQAQPSSVGSLVLKMRGQSLTSDEGGHRRAALSSTLQRSSVEAACRDVVCDCLRRVRAPVRLAELQARQVALFRLTNETHLVSLSERYAAMVPAYVTPERLDKFCSIYDRCSELLLFVRAALATQRERYLQWGQAGEGDEDLAAEVDVSDPLIMSAAAVGLLRSTLFPEEILEIFDEVDEEQLRPSWSYDLSSMLAELATALGQAARVGELEGRNDEHDVAEEKRRQKEERLAARMAAMDSDDEMEEEDEEEEEEEEEGVVKPVYPLIAAVQALTSEVHATLHLLTARPLPEPSIYEIASELLGQLADSIEQHRETALSAAELSDLVQRGVQLPQLPSAFTEEGAEAWAHALGLNGPHAEEVAKGKPPKNAPPPTDATKEQIGFYYKTLYTAVRGSLFDTGVDIFTHVDACLQKENGGATYSPLFEISTPRASDTSEGVVAMVNFNGSAFTQAPALSAFDVQRASKLKALAPVMQLLQTGAAAIVLVYESGEADALLPHFDQLRDLVLQQQEEYILQNNKRLKKLKQTTTYKELEFSKYASVGDFLFHTEKFFAQSQETYLAQTVPIFVLENLLLPGVVPPEPAYEEVESDDDEAPLCVGGEEAVVKRRADWEAKRPHRVKVPLNLLGGRPVKPSKGHSYEVGADTHVQCYAHHAAAIAEVVSVVAEGNPGGVMWVEGCLPKLFDPISHFNTLSHIAALPSLVPGAFVSAEVREACLWCGVLQLLPQAGAMIASLPEETPAPEEGDITATKAGGSEHESETRVAQHLKNLFPNCGSSGPRALAVVGGSIRVDKFTFLDQLIDSVDTIFLTGELALPFVCLSKRYLLAEYAHCAVYHSVCTSLLAKARMRGCNLCWPSDLVFGDEKVKASDMLKPYENFEPDARGEGFEYEGEGRAVHVSDHAQGQDEGAVETEVIRGFAYDLGPVTCAALREALQAADLVWVWGTPGLCEASAFQAGLQCLVEGTKDDRKTVLIGDCTVEWFARLLDSDGELNGDLVAAGAVAYLSRDSSVVAGVMGLYPSPLVQKSFSMRTPLADEFVYSKKAIEEEEEEEEEEEDDDD